MPRVPGFGRASGSKVNAALGRWVGGHAPEAVPGTGAGRARYVLSEQYGGSTRAMAADYGVSQRTAQRWVRGDRDPGRSSAGRQVAPQAAEVNERRAADAARAAVADGEPVRVRMKAYMGPHVDGAPDYRRRRTISRSAPPDDVLALIEAQEAGDVAAERSILSRMFGGYFDRGVSGGRDRADIGAVEWIEFE
jgi:hypothetical protein